MTKAFGYLRVSGKGQLKGDGFPRQRAAIERYAKANNIEVIQWFQERGVCGATELENRPALIELLEALAANGTQLVLIEKLDRLARDLMVQETIIADLRKRGFDLISVMEPDLLERDPSRKLMRQVFGAIAEYEKAMIVAKLRGARERIKAKEGRCEGQKPYGHTHEERGVIARMQGLRDAGKSYEQIAEVLNGLSVPTRHAGSLWRGATISKILAKIA